QQPRRLTAAADDDRVLLEPGPDVFRLRLLDAQNQEACFWRVSVHPDPLASVGGEPGEPLSERLRPLSGLLLWHNYGAGVASSEVGPPVGAVHPLQPVQRVVHLADPDDKRADGGVAHPILGGLVSGSQCVLVHLASTEPEGTLPPAGSANGRGSCPA